MESVSFVANGVPLTFSRIGSKKGKSQFEYSGEFQVNGYSFPIVSVHHFLTLLFKFNNLE